ncbi:adenosylcobalamin-dependent ribonucleoside-diphosphate reductase [Rhodospirillaceae bacterium KN72]|uniref:Vitamin B12-dependent ribonucleotide reductase n=1 Tax=Pacificispira spongiicola TaxID=2729598 RepID=A0A7Y0HFQ9_9PROT|nr:adenosylcobalamin-dependent ribonucleoside-diphosphate reductase [Pacificispira spongiicola]NMM43554.1 adenosylcobalamin-dependent ribonucleoside-diphosphate reductase [Pacificispira spongiicola]
MKYRLKQADGTPVDKTLDDSWQRTARALAKAERDPSVWEPRFLAALEGFRFLPAGRILAGAGTDRDVTLFNCFVMGEIPDSITGIFDSLKEAAQTLQQGGGIGYDFSTIRPKGATVQGVGADASGPLSFMDVWDAMCRTIMSAGSRRGAMMGTMRCDHPDIEAFVDAKSEFGRLTNFNMSVLATDAFMDAVAEGGDWDLTFGGKVYRTVKARALWDRIMTSTYDHAEPGVIFIDRINARNNLHYCETIQATNPCGEQPLPPYGACLLGSINLAKLVHNPFTEAAVLDQDALAELVAVAVRMMDNVVDLSRFPLDAQRQEALAKRRIGLGVTGLADAFLMCRVRYGSAESVDLTETWLRAVRDAAYRASIELASEKGAFPLFDADPYLAGETIQTLPEDIRKDIGRYGIRNALVTSIAPTGTISLVAENVSSGIEPVFSFRAQRKVLAPDGTRETHDVVDYAYRLYREIFGEESELPDYFVDAQALAPDDHLAIQAAAQRYIDSSISKTINLPEDTSFEAFKDVYTRAYAMGCKGCTTYRPNPVTGSVLSVSEPPATTAPPKPESPSEDAEIFYMSQPLDRPGALEGLTYKLRWPESDHATYITINDVIDTSGRRRPFEVFINSKNMEHYAWTVALTRMISAVFRRGGDVSFVVDELKAVFDPRGGYWVEGRYVPSILAAIGEVIERHMVEIGFLEGDPAGEDDDAASSRAIAANPSVRRASCPKCGYPSLVKKEGCDSCDNCGWSRCG